MLSSVEFHTIDKENNSFIFLLASEAHANLDTNFIVLKDGISIKIKDKFLRVIFKPRIYL